jgi:hypothetical protein
VAETKEENILKSEPRATVTNTESGQVVLSISSSEIATIATKLIKAAIKT